MIIPGLPGIDVVEFCTCMPYDGYVLVGDVVKWAKKGSIGPILLARPAEGCEFSYNEVTDTFDVTTKLERPIRYTIEFTAKTQAAVKEVHSLLDAIARHTTTFSNFRKESEAI